MSNQKLVEALVALPRNNARIGEREIGQIAVAIQLGAWSGQMMELPRSKETRRSKAEQELDKYARLCADLGKHILGMSRTSLSLIERQQGASLHPLQLFDHLAEAVKSGGRAIEALPDDQSDEPIKGAGKKASAREATRQAAWAYQEITGRPPTRVVDGCEYGQWIDFLRAVFVALHINASPEKQAQTYRTKIGQKQSI